jgi:hypothetical protein
MSAAGAEAAFADAAYRLSELGWALIRVEGKKARGSEWQKTQPAEPAFAAGQWAGWGRRYNLGVVLGPSGLVCFELDDPAAEPKFLELLGGGLPRTPIVRSGGKKLPHVYFRDPGGVEKRTRGGMELRAGPHMCVLPPSIHPESGDPYAWLDGLEPWTVPLAELPTAIIDYFGARGADDRERFQDERRIYGPGERHDFLMREACSDRRRGHRRDEILAHLRILNESRCRPPHADAKLVELAEDVVSRYSAGAAIPNDDRWEEREEPYVRDAPPFDDTQAESQGAAGGLRRHSWLPVPLVGAPPAEPPSICGLLYPGKRHLLSGESDSGKSMVLHFLQREEIRRGACVLHLDFEQGRSETLQRLHALGLSDEEIAEKFIYIAPSEPIGDYLADVLAVIHDRRPSLVSFDSFGNLAELHGLDENKRTDIGQLYRTVIEPMAIETGAAAAVLDHLAKDPKSDKYAIGSERKVGIPDVHLRAELVSPLGRGRRGVVKIVTKRDRSGFLRPGKLAEVVFDSDAVGAIDASIRFVEGESDEGKVWRPTVLMERVSRFLEPLGEAGASLNVIETKVTGRRNYIREAVNVLVADGYVAERQEGRARIFTSTKPFRETEQAGEEGAHA